MTKYIVKKIIISVALLLAAGFVMYMILCSILDPMECYVFGRETVVLRGNTLCRYRIDYDADCFSLLYFIPVVTGSSFDGGEITIPDRDRHTVFEDFDAKFYISPFSAKHIIKRCGLRESVYTLCSIESIS